MVNLKRSICLMFFATLLSACTPKVIVEKPVTIRPYLPPVSAELAQERAANFQSMMWEFIHNKEGKVRFSPKDAEWLILFSGNADAIVWYLGAAQGQLKVDRDIVNSVPETTDSKAVSQNNK